MVMDKYITALVHGSLTAVVLCLIAWRVAEWWDTLDEQIRLGTHSDITEKQEYLKWCAINIDVWPSFEKRPGPGWEWEYDPQAPWPWLHSQDGIVITESDWSEARAEYLAGHSGEKEEQQ